MHLLVHSRQKDIIFYEDSIFFLFLVVVGSQQCGLGPSFVAFALPF